MIQLTASPNPPYLTYGDGASITPIITSYFTFAILHSYDDPEARAGKLVTVIVVPAVNVRIGQASVVHSFCFIVGTSVDRSTLDKSA